MARLKETLELVLRFAFFAVVPIALVRVAALWPVTGALVQIVLGLAIFFGGEALRRIGERSRIAKLVLSTQLDLEAYYRVHPPRPFLYYVFYPLLFPYWLWNTQARAEFLLFKGFTLASFAMLMVSLGVQYARAFPPELGLAEFLPIAAKTFVVETIVVLVFLMPIVTSVVHYHSTRAPRRLAVLLVVGLASSSFAIYRIERRRDPVVSMATRTRVRLRTAARFGSAYDAQSRALAAAWKVLPKDREAVDTDGKVLDLPLEAAHAELTRFYKNDEAYAFDLWLQKGGGKGRRGTMVVYFEASKKDGPLWLAMERDEKGKLVTFHDPNRLPYGAFVAMKHAADAAE